MESCKCASGSFTKALTVPNDAYTNIISKCGTPERFRIMSMENDSDLSLNLIKTLD